MQGLRARCDAGVRLAMLWPHRLHFVLRPTSCCRCQQLWPEGLLQEHLLQRLGALETLIELCGRGCPGRPHAHAVRSPVLSRPVRYCVLCADVTHETLLETSGTHTDALHTAKHASACSTSSFNLNTRRKRAIHSQATPRTCFRYCAQGSRQATDTPAKWIATTFGLITTYVHHCLLVRIHTSNMCMRSQTATVMLAGPAKQQICMHRANIS